MNDRIKAWTRNRNWARIKPRKTVPRIPGMIFQKHSFVCLGPPGGQVARLSPWEPAELARDAAASYVEAYYINSCNQLPGGGLLTFVNIASNPSTGWALGTYGTSPNCGYSTYTPSPSAVYLCWNWYNCNPAPPPPPPGPCSHPPCWQSPRPDP